MRNLLRCRRGSAAFATVIALVPLIGVVALGGEAGSWYVTKQHAQNAADGAAYSGALTLACTLASNGTCTNDTQTVAYRGKEFAAQSAFCNAGDATAYPDRQCAASLPTGVSQAVTIATLTSWNGVNGNFVQATVQQTQPAYLAAVLGFTTIPIGATAIAQVNALTKPPCALALTGQLSFQGSANINTPNCSLFSNDPATNALSFTGNGNSINAASLAAVGGCTGSSTYCGASYTSTYRPPATNPFSNLDSDINTLCGANPTTPATCGLSTTGACKPGSTPVAYTAATPCANQVTTKGNTAVTLAPGVYFISGTLTLKGGSSITGTGVTLILLPGANIDTSGGGTLTITAPTSAPSAASLPAALQPDAALFQYMALYDAPCTNNSSTCTTANNVKFGGNSNINITGNMYLPTAAVTFQGNPTLTLSGANSCGELIAASLAFNGNATFNDAGTGCGVTRTPTAQYVALVQ
jgi:hypothetical protein